MPKACPVVDDSCLHSDGTQLVVACGNLVLVYDATDGLLMHRLRGHKDTVYCVTYSKDGKRTRPDVQMLSMTNAAIISYRKVDVRYTTTSTTTTTRYVKPLFARDYTQNNGATVVQTAVFKSRGPPAPAPEEG